MQRILAAGQACRGPCALFLCPDLVPRDAQPPFTVLEAGVCGAVQWQEIPCRRRDGLMLLANVPVALRLRDDRGRVFSAEASAEEELFLQYRCPEKDGWRGQIFVQAAVRPWRARCRSLHCDSCQVLIELLLEGYLLSPCAVGCPETPACRPDSRPLYPQSRFDSCCD